MAPVQHQQLVNPMPGPMYVQGGAILGAPIMATTNATGQGAQGGIRDFERPKVCAELNSQCCLALWCPCISVYHILNKAGMAQGIWASAVGIFVLAQFITNGVVPV